MKNFLCTVAFLLVASVGFANTNEVKPIKKTQAITKIETKTQKLLPRND